MPSLKNPRLRRTISRELRDAIWHDIFRWTFKLGDLGDITMFLAGSHGADAKEEAEKLREAFAVFDDLGWDRVDPRESFEFTMPTAALRRALGRRLKLSSEHLEHVRDSELPEHLPWTRGEDLDDWREVLEDHLRTIAEERAAVRAYTYVLGVES